METKAKSVLQECALKLLEALSEIERVVRETSVHTEYPLFNALTQAKESIKASHSLVIKAILVKED